jgi:hypothetical protein
MPPTKRKLQLPEVDAAKRMGQPIIREGPRQDMTKAITQVKIPLQSGAVGLVMVGTLALIQPMPLVGVV